MRLALGWVEHGTKLVHETLSGLDQEAWDVSTLLPGWTRRHLAAHLAANAEAIGNLVNWAATGTRTPMYATPEQRAADIATGAARPGAELAAWFDGSADRLSQAMGALTTQQWSAEVVTAQGRTVPASQTPWMRAREVMVHAVDLAAGVTFADLPLDFLESLCDDVVAKRGHVPEVEAPLDQRAAWLTGRRHDLTDAPALPPWL